MNCYNLALKLKRAGFPQLENGAGMMLRNYKEIDIEEYKRSDFIIDSDSTETAYWPTLEELREQLPAHIKQGMFPEEAFAYAYIALATEKEEYIPAHKKRGYGPTEFV